MLRVETIDSEILYVGIVAISWLLYWIGPDKPRSNRWSRRY